MRTLELCCCAGGMALGFRAAGVEFDVAVDYSATACDSYERNLGHRPIQLDVRDLLRLNFAGWSPREPLDLLVADPPCTPWSRAGKRKGLSDERDLLRETVEIIRQLRPVAFLIGNIPGLDDGSNLSVVQGVIGSLWRHGYAVDYAKLDAANYGVPQHRVRPFWFGRPRSSEPLRWPAPTHGDPAQLRTKAIPGTELLPWVTCRDALGHLDGGDIGRPLRMRSTPKHPASRGRAPSNTVTAGGSRHQCNTLEWPWDSPSTVVFAGNDRIGGPGKGSPCLRPNAVALSERAAAILQGFPDGAHFAGETKAARWSQIGMAMPPALAEAVARSIVRWFAANASRAA